MNSPAPVQIIDNKGHVTVTQVIESKDVEIEYKTYNTKNIYTMGTDYLDSFLKKVETGEDISADLDVIDAEFSESFNNVPGTEQKALVKRLDTELTEKI